MDRRHKPAPNAKPERNAMVYQYYKDHPELSLRQIGDIFNISKTRVCAIVKAVKGGGNEG